MRTGLTPLGAVRMLAAALAAGMALTACGSEAPRPADSGASIEATATATATTTTTEADPAGPYEAAVERTAAASRRSFSSAITVATASGPVEVQITGQRTGADRILTLTTGEGSITYAVTDGQATVDRGEGPQPIQLTEVPAAPSLEALRSMDDLDVSTAGLATGTIDASAVLGGDTTPTEPVDVSVRYEAGGFVEAFEMAAPDGSFSAEVTFSDVED